MIPAAIRRPRKKIPAERIERIRWMWDVGRFALAETERRRPANGKYSPGVAHDLAEHFRLPCYQVDQCRIFAQRVNRMELEQLCDPLTLVGEWSSWTKITWLIGIARRSERVAFARKAAQNGWSTRELGRQLKGRYGRRSRGGRPTKTGTTPLDKLMVLADGGEKWLRLAKPLEEAADIPKSLRAKLAKINVAVADLAQSVEVARQKGLPPKSARTSRPKARGESGAALPSGDRPSKRVKKVAH